MVAVAGQTMTARWVAGSGHRVEIEILSYHLGTEESAEIFCSGPDSGELVIDSTLTSHLMRSPAAVTSYELTRIHHVQLEPAGDLVIDLIGRRTAVGHIDVSE